jgi:hypothetical protein
MIAHARKLATAVLAVSAICVASTAVPASAAAKRPKRGDWIHPRELGPGPGHISKLPILWKSECRQPEGQGLAFSGLDQRTEDGRPHTRILVDGKWKNIYLVLRTGNTLQKHCDRANELKVALRRTRALARHIFFKGLEADAERKRLGTEVIPGWTTFSEGFAKLIAEVKTVDGPTDYERGQAAFALKHLDRAAAELKKAEGIATEALIADFINAMQRAQVAIEIAADALDCEPTPRVMSNIAYDAKTGLYVVFGGDHFDYLMNDTWVFDPKQKKWFQRHPASAPEPRGQHTITAPGDGTVSLEGGYYYPGRHWYTRVGPGRWTYDLKKNEWTGPQNQKAWAPDTRQYRGGAEHPSHFLKGHKPNAAEHAETLAALPVNTWVRMKPPHKPAGNRDWGTVALDVDNDLIVHWNGGHSCYCSTDAPHYHLGTNRWELAYPAEIPLGMVGASGRAVSGYSFNRNHWITNHTWNHYHYDRKLKRVLVAGSMSNWQFKFDPYSYIYNARLGEWESRFRKTGGIARALPGSISVVYTPLGTWAYIGRGTWYQLDYHKMAWKVFVKLKSGAWPRSANSDLYGQTYDPTKNRILAIGTPNPYRGCYTGKVIYALDLKTKKASIIKPENPEVLGNGFRFPREWRYLPDLGIFVIADGLGEQKLVRGKKRWVSTTDMPAYDPRKNRWLVLKVKDKPGYGVSLGMRYDERRKLLWSVDTRSNVHVLRLDLKSATERQSRDARQDAP